MDECQPLTSGRLSDVASGPTETLADRLHQLRDNFLASLERNKTASAMDQVARRDFVIDRELETELVAEAVPDRHRPPRHQRALEIQCQIWYQINCIESLPTNQNCPFR